MKTGSLNYLGQDQVNPRHVGRSSSEWTRENKEEDGTDGKNEVEDGGDLNSSSEERERMAVHSGTQRKEGL